MIAGRLHRLASGLFRLGDVGLWAAQQWPGHFKDLPKRPLIAVVRIAQGGQTTTAGACVASRSLAAAFREILDLDARCAAQEAEIEALKTRLKEAQVMAAK
jgi:hypothetical protein